MTGRVIASESARSWPRWVSTPTLTDGLPVSATRRCVWLRWTAAVWAASGATWSLASAAAPFMITGTRSAPPSAERTGGATRATSGSFRIRAVTSRTAARTAASSSGPDRAEISTCSTGSCPRPASAARVSARPASPTRWSSAVAWWVPAARPTPRHSTTNASHPASARQGCRALQAANRTVTGRLSSGRCSVGRIRTATFMCPAPSTSRRAPHWYACKSRITGVGVKRQP